MYVKGVTGVVSAGHDDVPTLAAIEQIGKLNVSNHNSCLFGLCVNALYIIWKMTPSFLNKNETCV